MKHALLVILVLALAYLSTVFWRQGLKADVLSKSNAAQVQVLVTDSVGVPLSAGVQITITNESNNQVSTVTTKNELGYWTAAAQPGDYTVEATADGYAVSTQYVTLTKGQTQTVTFYLDQASQE